MALGVKLNLVSLEQQDDERFMVVMWVGQEEGEVVKAKEGKLLLKSIKEVLKRYKDALIKELSQELLPKREVDHKIKVIPRVEPPSKAIYRLN